MRTRKLILMTALAALAAVAALGGTASVAAADFQHVVGTGESLSSVAAADGLSVSQLAAANGLPADAQLTAGTHLAIPPQGATASEAAASAPAAASSETASTATPTASATDTASTASGDGAYVVQPGDTLSGIAARAGVSVDALAAANGLSVDGVLPAGRALSLSGSTAAPAATAEPVSDTSSQPASTSSEAAPASGGSVSAADIGQIASENGVSPALAEAIGYQESGFNNAEVSPTGATGVMQIEPGTWKDINSLGGPALSPDSATDNVRGGVELLHSLLDQTGGDPSQAAAAYYQGLQSLREHGMYRDTQRYVANVMALESRFGG